MTGMQCEMQCMSHATFGVSLKRTQGVIKLTLAWTPGKINVCVLCNNPPGTSHVLHECDALYSDDKPWKCPVYAAAVISTEAIKYIRASGLEEKIPMRRQCSEMCSMVRRYKCGELVRALQALSGSKILRRLPGIYIFNNFKVEFSKAAIGLQRGDQERGVCISFQKGVTIEKGHFVHEFDKIASEEFYRILALAAAVCDALRLTQH